MAGTIEAARWDEAEAAVDDAEAGEAEADGLEALGCTVCQTKVRESKKGEPFSETEQMDMNWL